MAIKILEEDENYIELRKEFRKTLFEMARLIEKEQRLVENSSFLKHIYKKNDLFKTSKL